MHDIRKCAILAALLAITCSLGAGTVWKSTTGGDLNEPANWGGALPAASDAVNFSGNQSAPVTATSDLTVDKFMFGGGSSVFAMNEDVGPKTRVITFDYATDVTVTSGRFAFNGSAVVGQNAAEGRGDNTLTLTGAQTVGGGSGGERIYVGQNGVRNAVFVKDGATLKAEPILGYYPGAASNKLVVSGTDAALLSTAHLYLGAGGGYNKVIVTDGADLTVGGTGRSVYLGSSVDSHGGGEGNSLVVSDAASLTASGGLVIGDMTSSNRVEVLGGAAVTLTQGVTVGGSRNATYTASDDVRGNVLSVSGTGSVLKATSVSVSSGAGSADNWLKVTAGGAVVLKNDGQMALLGGAEGSSSGHVVVDGGVFAATTTAAKAQNFYVGYKGADCTLEVRNGGTFVASNFVLNVGYNALGARTSLSVGKNSLMSFSAPGANVFIGQGASACTLSVDGGEAAFADQTLHVCEAGGISSSDGGLISAQTIMVGSYSAMDSWVKLDGGAVEADSTILFGNGSQTEDRRCTLTIGADGSLLKAPTVKLNKRMNIVFNMPRKGYTQAPFQCTTTLRTPSDVRVTVNVGKCRGGTYPLFKSVSIADIANLQWSALPDGYSLVLEGDTIFLKTPPPLGLAVIVR